MPALLDVHHSREFWRGAIFPIGKVGSPVVIAEDIDEVFSSILQILNTRRGERVMYPEFGSDLGPILWEPYDQFLLQQVRTELIRALSLWEPRVSVLGIAFDTNARLINLGILIVSIEIVLVNNPRVSEVVKVPISSQGSFFAGS